MFELNSNLVIKEEILLGSKIFTIDNFYKNPDEVYDFLFNREVNSHSLRVISLSYICDAKKLPSFLRLISLK